MTLKNVFSVDKSERSEDYATDETLVSELIEAVKKQAASVLDEHLLNLYRAITDNENSRLLGCREDEKGGEDSPLGEYPELRHIYPEKGGQRQKRSTILDLLFYSRYSSGEIGSSEFTKRLREYWLPLYEREAVERLTEDLVNLKIKIRQY